MIPKNIIVISNPKILKIPIQENHEPMVDLLKSSGVVVDKDNYGKSIFKVRQTVFKKLLEAQTYLPKNIRLIFIEGYRPLSLQKKYFKGYSDKLKKNHPNWNKEKIHREASKFVAPPEIIPPHLTGGAVDVALVIANGKEIDMGTRMNVNPERCSNKCYTLAKNISNKAKKNRQLLIDVMSKSGFVNYPTEWWHWSYGDRYWAYYKKQPFAIYGSVEQE